MKMEIPKSLLNFIKLFHWSFFIFLILTIIFFIGALINSATKLEMIFFWNTVLSGILTIITFRIRNLLIEFAEWIQQRKT